MRGRPFDDEDLPGVGDGHALTFDRGPNTDQGGVDRALLEAQKKSIPSFFSYMRRSSRDGRAGRWRQRRRHHPTNAAITSPRGRARRI